MNFEFHSECSLPISYRGDYDYCRVLGTRQLYPLEVGEDNPKSAPKKFKLVQILLLFCANSARLKDFGHFLVPTHASFCQFSVK